MKIRFKVVYLPEGENGEDYMHILARDEHEVRKHFPFGRIISVSKAED
jgi:hypothetical protein